MTNCIKIQTKTVCEQNVVCKKFHTISFFFRLKKEKSRHYHLAFFHGAQQTQCKKTVNGLHTSLKSFKKKKVGAARSFLCAFHITKQTNGAPRTTFFLQANDIFFKITQQSMILIAFLREASQIVKISFAIQKKRLVEKHFNHFENARRLFMFSYNVVWFLGFIFVDCYGLFMNWCFCLHIWNYLCIFPWLLECKHFQTSWWKFSNGQNFVWNLQRCSNNHFLSSMKKRKKNIPVQLRFFAATAAKKKSK